MKLELKHLAPYLPFKLNCLNQNLPDTEMVVEELIGISNHITWSGVFNAKYGSNHIPICGIKPILRPLSDLSKYIPELNLTPLKALYNISIQRDVNREIDDYEFIKAWGGNYLLRVHCRAHNSYLDFNYGDFTFIYSDTNYKTKIRFNPDYYNQYFMHKCLFEWHFDVFGLIEKGLAIDKNTLYYENRN